MKIKVWKLDKEYYNPYRTVTVFINNQIPCIKEISDEEQCLNFMFFLNMDFLHEKSFIAEMH